MAEVNQRNEWVFGKIDDMLLNKEELRRHNFLNMLNKTIEIFKYNNLPDTIKQKDLETQLQLHGFTVWKEVKGNLYTFYAGLGGKPNPYYLPTLAIIANPALSYNTSLTIDEECVVMLNDHFYQGLTPLFNKYSSLLTEAEVSLNYAVINARVPALIQADNDSTKEAAEQFFKDIRNGNGYGIIGSKEFFEGIKSHDFFKTPHIKELIEGVQYIKGSWYNEIGLNSTFNMKREAINEAEANLNEDILYPTIDSMLEQRQIGLEKVNAMYGTNISVEFNSAWAKERENDELAEEKAKAEIEKLIQESKNPNNEGVVIDEKNETD